MRQIRLATDLSENQRHHQFSKLEKHDFITVEKTDMMGNNGAGMKVAKLTEKAYEEINKGFLQGEPYKRKLAPDNTELAEELDEVKAENDALAKELAGTQEWLSSYLIPIVRALRAESIRHNRALSGDLAIDLDQFDIEKDEIKQFDESAKKHHSVTLE